MPNSRILQSAGILVFLLVPVVPLHFYFDGNWYSIFHSYSLAMFFGILSYCWFALTLLLACRIRILDILFGQDSLIVFHRWVAGSALMCAALHITLKLVFFGIDGLLTQTVLVGLIAATLFFLVATITMLFMVKSYLHKAKFFVNIKNEAIKKWKLDYSKLKLFHNLTALSLALVTIHVLLASPTAETSERMALILIIGSLSILTYVYHKIIRPAINRLHPLIITQVRALSPEITQLQAAPLKGDLPLHGAGQFGYFKIVSKACGTEEHPFTISSRPKTNYLSITVKALGNYTSALTRVLPGDKLLLSGPYGKFTVKKEGYPYLFIAGGIGITPFLSIIADLHEKKMVMPVTLVWSVRKSEELIDEELFKNYSYANKHFTYLPIITSEQNAQKIDLNLLSGLINKNEISRIVTYVCGPQLLRTSVIHNLRTLGVSPHRIHFESFSS